jgi:DNA-directed RNA polymerase subunit RPC12/RpoP
MFGYVCATCSTTINPNDLIRRIHPAYTTVIFGFLE